MVKFLSIIFFFLFFLGIFYIIITIFFDVCSYWTYIEERKGRPYSKKVVLNYKNFKDFYSLAPYYYDFNNNFMPLFHSYVRFDDMHYKYDIFFESYLQTLMALFFVYFDKKENNKRIIEEYRALNTKEYLQIIQKHIDDTLKKAEKETAEVLEINKQVKDNLTQPKEYIYYR